MSTGRLLRIAEVAPVFVPVPPLGYGGIERVVSLITEALVARGHDITLFASGDSRTAGRLSAVIDRAPGWRHGVLADEMYHEAHAFLRAQEFEIVHDHGWYGAYFGAFLPATTPVVTTLHLPWDDDGRRSHSLIGDRIHRVASSDDQRRANPDVSQAATIHHGLDPATHPYREDKDDYLVFVGRTVREKGPELAVEVARRAGRRLKLVVKREEAFEREHWDREVAPRLTGDEDIIEGATHDEKVAIVGGAAGLLFPIQWPEPFGLVMVEAMACGTPVLAMRRGAALEVIEDGVTGFVVDTVGQMVETVSKLDAISPATCRERMVRLFSVDTMADRYERLFRSLASAR